MSYNGDTQLQAFSRSRDAGQLVLLSCELHSAPEGPSRSSGLTHRCLTQVPGRGSAGDLCTCCCHQTHTSGSAPCCSPAPHNRESKLPSQHTITDPHFAPVPAETLLTHPPNRPQASTCNLLPGIIITSINHQQLTQNTPTFCLLPCRFLT